MTDKPEILQLSPLRDVAQTRLEAGFQPLRIALNSEGAAEFSAAFSASDAARIRALVSWGSEPIGEALLAQLPALEMVACTSAGYEAFDTKALAARGIKMTNASWALADEVADLAILLMLAAKRRLVQADAHVRSGAWAKTGEYPLQRSVTGKRLGIAGMGAIGQDIAKRATAMGMEIAYWGRAPKDGLPYRFESDLETLAAQSDVLIAMMPGGAATRHVVSEAVLRALGPQGLFLNLARGSVVDEEALISLLQSGDLGMAALDVFENEPAIDPRFASLDNVLLAPHIGSATVETRDAMALSAVENLEAYFAGRPLKSEVRL